MRRTASALVMLGLAGCPGRSASKAPDARSPIARTSVADALAVASSSPADASVTPPARVAAGGQSRWRYLSGDRRPRGVERWRLDLAGRDASGEPATDGNTVFVAAAAASGDLPGEGEVYGIDLIDGTVRWHVPLGGLHGEPLESVDGVVLVDTIPACVRRLPSGACADQHPCGIVALDASTGRTLFRTASGSDAMHAGWTAPGRDRTVWVHDGASSLRAVSLPTGAPGARWDLGGTVLNVDAWNDGLIATVRRRRSTVVERWTPGEHRPGWSRVVPYPTACQPVRLGPVCVLSAFSSETLAGAPRGLAWADGADLWSSTEPPHHVETCGVVDSAVLYQVVDGVVTGWSAVDGRRRARWPLPSAPTGDMAVVVNSVFYVSLHGRLAGIDLIDGHTAVEVRTGASRAAGAVVWQGHGAVATQDPGLVIGFE